MNNEFTNPFTYEQLKKLALFQFLSESDLLNEINEIQKVYTSERERISEFTPQKVAAYTIFYMPSNLSKITFLLSKLSDHLREEILNSSIIDIGCGPGTYAWSLLELNSNLNYLGVDTNELMLEQARIIKNSLYKNEHIQFSRSIQDKKLELKKAKKTLILSQSFNEMSKSELDKYTSYFKPDYLIIIEAGTPKQFKRIIDWRQAQVDYIPLYPCLSSKLPSSAKSKFDKLSCPIQTSDYCHQKMKFKWSEDFERLAQKCRIDRRNQTFIAHLYQSKNVEIKNETQQYSDYIVHRFLKETKFSYLYSLCLDRENIKVEILKKNLDLKRKQMIERYQPGSIMSLKEMEIKNGVTRAKLMSATS